jgi:LysM repeat protein
MIVHKVFNRLFVTIIGFLACLSIHQDIQAQKSSSRISRSEYIETWKMVALQKMFDHGIPASITLAQGILESGSGNSTLAKKANNHFGIKCHGWDGKGYTMDDDEKDECFRKYDRAEDSFEDHSLFLKKKRYAALFELDITDYKGWAKGLKKAGYATSPQYADRLIKIIEDTELYTLDKLSYADFIAMGGSTSPKHEPSEETSSKENTAEVTINRNGREVKQSSNQVKYVLAKKGDQVDLLAQELNLGRWQLRKYNDLEKNEEFEKGDIIYIQPKKSKAKEEYHILKAQETYRDVSQRYGIKLKKLLKRNQITADTPPKPGMKLRLR